jgi:hypothetical protein
MTLTKKIIIGIFVLFVFFAQNAIAFPCGLYCQAAEQTKTSQLTQNDANPFNNESIETIQGLLAPFLKANESQRPGFQNLQNSKKSGNYLLSWQSFTSPKVYYSSYTLKRINSIHSFPFYIAYHRLTI